MMSFSHKHSHSCSSRIVSESRSNAKSSLPENIQIVVTTKKLPRHLGAATSVPSIVSGLGSSGPRGRDCKPKVLVTHHFLAIYFL